MTKLLTELIDEAAFQMSLSVADDEQERREYWRVRPEYEVKAHYKWLAKKALDVFSAKIREVVEGAGLTPTGISLALNQADLTDEVHQEHEVVAEAQFQAILKVLMEVI